MIEGLFTKLVSSVSLKIKKNLNNDIEHKIGRYKISLPPQHTLAIFQKEYKLYDRFLPVLARFIQKGKVIVDVGANVGDTAITMLNETQANIVCVEPSEFYFKYLKKNINNLSEEDRNKLTCIQSLVGEQDTFGELVHHDGTASIAQTNGDHAKIKKEKLDDILNNELEISLIKVDTDGFDYDVLMSARKIIEHNRPILFWENYIDTKEQYEGYEKLYKFLSAMNYNHVYIFDNFGNIMIKNTTYEVLKNINDYIHSTQKYGGAKTIYYTDILAVTEDKRELIQDVIDTYEREWVNVEKPITA
jgi:FkbM family methyltransferase